MNDAVNFSLSPYIHSAGRLFKYQNFRLRRKPLADYNLLLVATAQKVYTLLIVWRFYTELVHVFLAHLLYPLLIQYRPL
ncbi:hypothetical protein D3C76_1754370 [compost metagenome]